MNHGPIEDSARSNPSASRADPHFLHSDCSYCVSPQSGQASILCFAMIYHRILATCVFVITPLLHLGCANNEAQPPISSPKTHIQQPSPIVAIVGGKTLRREDLWPSLIESSGKEILQDIALGIAVDKALSKAGFPKVTEVEIKNEQSLIEQTFNNPRKEVFNEILAKKGLGEKRLNDLCRRSAGLRKLVQKNISVSDESIERMFAVIYGPKYPTKIIVTSTRTEASKAIDRINNGESFSEIAATMSIDQSAIRGGLVEAISLADPAWPSAIRELLPTLQVGDCSPPTLVGDRWVVVTMTAPPTTVDTKFKEVESEMRKLSRRAKERLAMEQLAIQLVRKNPSTVLDYDLKKISQD